jgi:hypothetical protein
MISGDALKHRNGLASYGRAFALHIGQIIVTLIFRLWRVYGLADKKISRR